MSAIDELWLDAKQATAIKVTFRVDDAHFKRQLECALEVKTNECIGKVKSISDKSGEYHWQTFYARDLSGALTRATELFEDMALQFGSVKVSTRKSPKSARELTPMAFAALGEAFAVSVPDDDELRQLVKAFRAEQKANKKRRKESREAAFLERHKMLVEKHAPKTQVVDDKTFIAGLRHRVGDPSRVRKAMSMLKKDHFQLFSDISDSDVVGVVKSQTDASLIYACRLASDGAFSCCTQNLNACGGLHGYACKHLLVLLVGLVQASELDPVTADAWLEKHVIAAPKLDRDAMGDVF